MARKPRKLSHAEFQRFNFHCPAAWRWLRAVDLFNRKKAFDPATDDPPTGRILEYLSYLGGPGESRQKSVDAAKFEDIATARHLAEHGGSLRAEVDAWLLTGQPSTFITERVGIPVATLDAYESSFFNCRERMHARDWIHCQLIRGRPILTEDRDDLPYFWRLFAYYGGILALDGLLVATAGRPGMHPYSADVLNRVHRAIDLMRITDLEILKLRFAQILATPTASRTDPSRGPETPKGNVQQPFGDQDIVSKKTVSEVPA